MEVCKRRGTLRDKNGSIILPIIVIKRTSVGFDDDMPLSFDNDVQGKFISLFVQVVGGVKIIGMIDLLF